MPTLDELMESAVLEAGKEEFAKLKDVSGANTSNEMMISAGLVKPKAPGELCKEGHRLAERLEREVRQELRQAVREAAREAEREAAEAARAAMTPLELVEQELKALRKRKKELEDEEGVAPTANT